MTGFGAARQAVEGGTLSVEVRTVNHRFCEVKLRLPRELAALEARAMESVRAHVERGTVEITVHWQIGSAEAERVSADLELARAYARQIEAVGRAVGDDGRLRDLVASMPGVLAVEEPAPLSVEEAWPRVAPVLEAALSEVLEMRTREGRAIAEDLRARLRRIRSQIEVVREAVPEAIAQYEARLEARLTRLAGAVEVDASRLAAEVALLVDRTDVSEELTRLESHLAQFEGLLSEGGVVGRKMDFLVQEMNREVNTIGAKSQSSRIGRAVVELKAELERIREQVQNVE